MIDLSSDILLRLWKSLSRLLVRPRLHQDAERLVGHFSVGRDEAGDDLLEELCVSGAYAFRTAGASSSR